VQRRIVIIIGSSGSGKTLTATQLIEEKERVAVFDMVRDSQYESVKDVQIIDSRPRDFAYAIAMPGPWEEIGKPKPDAKRFKVVYHPNPRHITPVENNSMGLVNCPEFEPIVKLCHERGDMYLVIDEAHLLTNSYNCPPELMMVNLIGRHKGMSLILVTQSFTGIHPAIRKNADEFYFWKTIEPSELDGIRDRCGKEVMEQVKGLRSVELDDEDNFKAPGQRLHWSKFKGVVEVTE
jgi:hypothetical protein